MKKLYLHDLENNKMYPLSMLADKEIIFTKEDVKDDITLPENFTFELYYRPGKGD